MSATMLLWTSAIDYRHQEACSHLDIKNSCFFLETLDCDGDSRVDGVVLLCDRRDRSCHQVVVGLDWVDGGLLKLKTGGSGGGGIPR